MKRLVLCWLIIYIVVLLLCVSFLSIEPHLKQIKGVICLTMIDWEYENHGKVKKAKRELREITKQAVIWQCKNSYRSPDGSIIQSSIDKWAVYGRMGYENWFFGFLQGKSPNSVPLDPWGRPYVVDLEKKLVFSRGNKLNYCSDDIVGYFCLIEARKAKYKRRKRQDRRPRFIEWSPSTLMSDCEEISAKFESGSSFLIDFNMVKVWLDGSEIKNGSGCKKTADLGHVKVELPKDSVSVGKHKVVVQVQDTDGNINRKEWQFFKL